MDACMDAYMDVCMDACMDTCMNAFMHAFIYASMHASMLAFTHAPMHVSMRPCMHPCMHSCMHRCMRACIHPWERRVRRGRAWKSIDVQFSEAVHRSIFGKDGKAGRRRKACEAGKDLEVDQCTVQRNCTSMDLWEGWGGLEGGGRRAWLGKARKSIDVYHKCG